MGKKETGGAVIANDDASPERISVAVPRELVIDYLKIFDELERATHAHRQFHHSEASRLSQTLLKQPFPERRLVSPAQVQLIIDLSERGPGTIGELATRLKVTPSAISLLVDRMESHGIVERIRSTLDRRVVQVRLTDVATQISAIMLRVARAQMEEFLESTPPDQREPFLRNLTRFVKTIERVEDFIPTAPPLTTPEVT